MNLLKIARVPAVTVDERASVLDAVEIMTRLSSGAVLIVDRERPIGICTEGDVLERAIARGRPLPETRASEVMTSPLVVADLDTSCDEALRRMVSNHVRHLPIVDAEGRVQGILGTRHLLHNMVDDLSQEVRSLSAYLNADGIGG